MWAATLRREMFDDERAVAGWQLLLMLLMTRMLSLMRLRPLPLSGRHISAPRRRVIYGVSLCRSAALYCLTWSVRVSLSPCVCVCVLVAASRLAEMRSLLAAAAAVAGGGCGQLRLIDVLPLVRNHQPAAVHHHQRAARRRQTSSRLDTIVTVRHPPWPSTIPLISDVLSRPFPPPSS